MNDVKMDPRRLIGLRIAAEKQSPMQAAALAAKSGVIKCRAEPMTDGHKTWDKD